MTLYHEQKIDGIKLDKYRKMSYSCFVARLAQLVEQPVYTGKVGGSSPSPRTFVPVVQWIEQETSKLLIEVRFLSGTPRL